MLAALYPEVKQAKINSIHRLITDRSADRQLIDKIKAEGVDVQLV